MLLTFQKKFDDKIPKVSQVHETNVYEITIYCLRDQKPKSVFSLDGKE